MYAVDGDVWLYVTSHQDGTEVIRRAVGDGRTQFSDDDFITVIDHTINDTFAVGTRASSPSVTAWASP